eukprot:5346444-Amphidinium_carterae.1
MPGGVGGGGLLVAVPLECHVCTVRQLIPRIVITPQSPRARAFVSIFELGACPNGRIWRPGISKMFYEVNSTIGGY